MIQLCLDILGPKTRVCYVCGRQYGIHSFEIHLKQCKELWIAREAEKDPRERKKLPEDPMVKLTAATQASGNNFSLNLDASKTLDELNRLATETFNTESMEACKFCARTFLSKEKLAIHNKSCTADNPARRVTDNVNRRPANSNSVPSQGSTVPPVKPTLSSRTPTPAKRRTSSRGSSSAGQQVDDEPDGSYDSDNSNDVTHLKIQGDELRRVQSPPSRPHLSGSAGRSLRKSASPSEQSNLDSGQMKHLSRSEAVRYLTDEISRIEHVAVGLVQSISSLKDVLDNLSRE
jgi:hypothetical protein